MLFIERLIGVKKTLKAFVKDILFGYFFPRTYRKYVSQKADPKHVVFLESIEEDIPDSFLVLYNHLNENYIFDLQFVSLGKTRVGALRYYVNCWRVTKLIADASYVFLNDASDLVSCLPLRRDTKVIQLWHGCGAFKKWGMSCADLKFGGSREEILKHPFYNNLSLVTISSPEVAWAYSEAMVIGEDEGIIQPIGVSRTDVYFDQNFLATARSHVEEIIPKSRCKKVILYAPTFRGRVASALGPDALDVSAFKKALGEDYVLLIKHHPFVKQRPPIQDGCRDFAFDVTEKIPIDELLSVADVCISDYSSLVFEYSLFLRPMIFFAYDIDDYSDWRGFYYDYEDLTPGPVFNNTKDMLEYIKNIDNEFDVSRVKDFRDKFMSACDGCSTERICEVAFGDDLATAKKSSPIEKLMSEDPEGLDISIVIPAYNAMPDFRKTLESILNQSYEASRMEVIITDDCSTDGTWEEAIAYSRNYPDLIKVGRLSQPSGSPSRPRNIGLGKARGKYVFFLDADDWLGPQAVEKMLEHALEWDSDVLVVKLHGEDGRIVPQSMFTENQPKVNVFQSKVMWTFGPYKLFKRSFLEENQLLFPSFMPEDISFVLRAYCKANVVSVAADYDYYHLTMNGGLAHASETTWDELSTNIEALEDIFSYIDEEVPYDCRNQTLLRRLFKRDIVRMFESAANNPRQSVWYERIRSMVMPYYVWDMYKTCTLYERLVLEAGIHGSLKTLQGIVGEGNGIIKRCSFQKIGSRVLCRMPIASGGRIIDVTQSNDLSTVVVKRTSLKRIPRRLLIGIVKPFLNGAYRMFCAFGRNNEVIFVSRQSNSVPDDFKALGDRFRDRGYKPVYLVKKLSKKSAIPYLGHVLKELYHLARCRVCVLDRYDPVVSLLTLEYEGKIDTEQWESPLHQQYPTEPVVIQVWHAFGAFKRFGYQSLNTSEGHTIDVALDYRIHANYSYIICAGETSRMPFSQAFSYPIERVVSLGRPGYASIIKRIVEKQKSKSEKTTILFAPTLRKDPGSKHPIRDLFDRRDELFVNVEYDVLWSFHPLEETGEASLGLNVYLETADYIVTDYSSIVYEAHLLGKGFLFYVPDLEEYEEMPGLNIDLKSISRETVYESEQDLLEALDRLAHGDESGLRKSNELFIGDTFSDCSPDPAESITSFVCDGILEE